MQAFCRKRRVEPRLSLSGGDPLCYSHFWELYEAVGPLGVAVSILGNPISAGRIARLLAVAPPTYYQVSLEGLRERNDAVRGAGHFDRVMDFLAEPRRRGLRTHVMLTLTAENLDDVLPLGEQLRGLTTRFTFNRLSQVGNAADMPALEPRRFMTFLRQYLAARRNNPGAGREGEPAQHHPRPRPARPFPGCTGYGCGAAFNFVALLPDGEVHACRKFPSPIGNIRQSTPRRNLPLGSRRPLPRRLGRLPQLPPAPPLRRLPGGSLRTGPRPAGGPRPVLLHRSAR